MTRTILPSALLLAASAFALQWLEPTRFRCVPGRTQARLRLAALADPPPSLVFKYAVWQKSSMSGPSTAPQAPTPVVVVMGVSGAGKSTLTAALAARLGWARQDGDDLHPPANVEKMRRGVPLTDADRAPWLAAVRRWIDDRRAENAPCLLACSALKQSYREGLRAGRPGLRFVWLTGDRDILHRRLTERTGHFAGPQGLAGQLTTLEAPAPKEGAIVIDIALPTERQVERVLEALGHGGRPGPA
ncbi:gluconokinase, GntK/IdnK-type [Phenylobacterium sp.]|uniref:gluconokinase n=1 Tax=Phenylobacterium sp. TaxID=1871053 RepID=UPI00286E598F|nr:gluconokinase, GntK/IdnK-type [Phenylobacterium sp.]